MDDDLEEAGAIAADRDERRVNLGEHLPDLPAGVEARVVGDLHPVRRVAMGDDVGIARGGDKAVEGWHRGSDGGRGVTSVALPGWPNG